MWQDAPLAANHCTNIRHNYTLQPKGLTSLEVVGPQVVVEVQLGVLSNQQVAIRVVDVVRTSNAVDVTLVEWVCVGLVVACQDHLQAQVQAYLSAGFILVNAAGSTAAAVSRNKLAAIAAI